MIVVHVDVAVSLKKHIQNTLCMVVGPTCVPACLFKMSNVVYSNVTSRMGIIQKHKDYL